MKSTMAKGAASSSDPTPMPVPSLCISNIHAAYNKDTDDEDEGLRNNEDKEHPSIKKEYELDTDDESSDKKLAGIGKLPGHDNDCDTTSDDDKTLPLELDDEITQKGVGEPYFSD